MISQSESAAVATRLEARKGYRDGIAGPKIVAAPSLIEGVPLLCSATFSRRRMA
jgi:hypothetical protein